MVLILQMLKRQPSEVYEYTFLQTQLFVSLESHYNTYVSMMAIV